MPFYIKYVVCYSNKYKIKEFDKFCNILKKLQNKPKYTKDQFIKLVKLTYELNPEGKGKNRKRTLDVVLYIIEEKCQ